MAPTNSFADVEIRIFPAEQNNGQARYPVELRLNGEEEFPRGFLTPVQDVMPWIPSADAQADGERLFGCLFADATLSNAWAAIRGRSPQRRIRLWIDNNAPELHTIPWELLRESPPGGLAVDLAATDASPFSRYLAGAWQPGSPILQRPIKILVAVANPAQLPAGLQAVDVAAEFAALQAATQGNDIQLTLLPQPCTLESMENELRKGYHALHYIGHGRYARQLDATQLVMDNPQTPNQPFVDGVAVAEMLQRQLEGKVAFDDRLRLVFLSSCETAKASSASAFRSLAPLLVKAGVPAVVAMQDLVPVVTARAFAGAFYHHLLEHGCIDLAANQARSNVLAQGLAGSQIPVLFMRLRTGELLGKRGQVSAANSEADFWPFLIQYTLKGLCIPFIGPRATAGLLPEMSALAAQLADKYGYPLQDRQSMARVAQFIASRDPEELREAYLEILGDGARHKLSGLGLQLKEEDREQFEKGGLAGVAKALHWAGNVLAAQENEIHHLLAKLELPLYITTNHDSFMVEALNQPAAVQRRNGNLARQVGPRWEWTEAGKEKYALLPPPGRDQPIVFHLNGYDGDPVQAQHLVLSEDDYLEHLLRLSRDQEFILPSNLLGEVAQKSFLFIGYDLDDWEFRVLLRGLIKSIAQTTRFKKFHVGVQLESGQVQNPQAAREYLQRYLGEFKINIYWGTPLQFVTDLHARWQAAAGN